MSMHIPVISVDSEVGTQAGHLILCGQKRGISWTSEVKSSSVLHGSIGAVFTIGGESTGNLVATTSTMSARPGDPLNLLPHTS